MSRVTDIILTTMVEDGASTDGAHPNTDKLNSYIEKNHNGGHLVKVDKYAGGGKAMQCDVFMAAINYMDITAFVEWFADIEWEYPECVQLLIKDEDDDLFAVYVPKI